jgi:hypothetical protein
VAGASAPVGVAAIIVGVAGTPASVGGVGVISPIGIAGISDGKHTLLLSV